MTDDIPIRDGSQLGFDLRPGKREPAQPRLVRRPLSPEEQFAREVDDTIGSYRRTHLVTA